MTTPAGERPNPEFDPEALQSWLDLLRKTIARYFRLEVIGAENIPEGRVMIVGCHSGVLPYDAGCTLVAIEQETGRLGHAVGDWIFGRWKPVERFLRRIGAIVGERTETAALLRNDEIMLVFPGGADDMTRPIWRDPYRVLPHKGFAKGNGGYIKIALETGTPIVPLAVVGAEEIHMMIWDFWPLARLLGWPYFPILGSLVPLPAKLYVRFGPAIDLGHGPEAARDQAIVNKLNVKVRRELQDLIDETRSRRRGIFWSTYANGRSRPDNPARRRG
ncbi:MAG: lysophospholipid acyltransferase family protein [Myxococcota bacterium]